MFETMQINQITNLLEHAVKNFWSGHDKLRKAN